MALLRAVGYRPEHLRKIVIAENVYLLVAGIVIGTVCALVAIAPAFLSRGGHLPNPSLALAVAGGPGRRIDRVAGRGAQRGSRASARNTAFRVASGYFARRAPSMKIALAIWRRGGRGSDV